MYKDIISRKRLEITAVYINRGPVREVPCTLTVNYSAAFRSTVIALKWHGTNFQMYGLYGLVYSRDFQTFLTVTHCKNYILHHKLVRSFIHWFVLSTNIYWVTTTFSDTEIGIEETAVSKTDKKKKISAIVELTNIYKNTNCLMWKQAKLSRQKANQWLPGLKMGEEIDFRETPGYFLGWWKCPISWLWCGHMTECIW